MPGQMVDYIKKMIPYRVKKPIYKLLRRFCAGFLEAGVKVKPQYWDVYPDDVFLVSYPRSGNTWMRYLMTHLRFPEAEWNVISLLYVFPEIYSSIDPSCAPRPRWVKSHDAYTPSYPRVIYLLRDGRDVAVSLYHWGGFYHEWSFDEFVRKHILSNEHGWGKREAWHTHVTEWLAHANTSDFLLVQYEKLVENPVVELQRVTEFVGLLRSEKDIAIAIEKSSFEKQKADIGKRMIVGVKGGPGKWKEFFSEELHAEFWQAAGNVMRSVGYEDK